MQLNRQQKAVYGLKIEQIEKLIEGQEPTEKKPAFVQIDMLQPIVRQYFFEKYIIAKTGVNVYSFTPKAEKLKRAEAQKTAEEQTKARQENETNRLIEQAQKQKAEKRKHAENQKKEAQKRDAKASEDARILKEKQRAAQIDAKKLADEKAQKDL